MSTRFKNAFTALYSCFCSIRQATERFAKSKIEQRKICACEVHISGSLSRVMAVPHRELKQQCPRTRTVDRLRELT